MDGIAKGLILMGVLLLLCGGLLLLLSKIPGIGRLPGDIVIKRDNFTLYFPLMTGILVSLILSLLFIVLGRR